MGLLSFCSHIPTRAFAVSRPRPEVAPVTRATVPFMSAIIDVSAMVLLCARSEVDPRPRGQATQLMVGGGKQEDADVCSVRPE